MSRPILYCNRESGHSYKVALAMALMGVEFEQRAVDLALRDRAFLLGDAPTIADVSCCGYLFWTDDAGVALAPWPAIEAWLARIRSLPGWQAPYDLLVASAPILAGTRT